MGSEQKLLQATQAKTRLLLALWDLGGVQNPVLKGKLNQRVGRKKENSGEYDKAYQQLEQGGAIAIVASQKKVKHISLTEQGLERLSEGLNSSDFEFSALIGAKTANALLKWIRQSGKVVNGATASVEKINQEVITSYEEFKSVALEVYDKLNQNHSLDDLVAIYLIRREIGDRVTRTDFNAWLLEMQKNDIVQLIGGEMTDITPDKAEDSITTKLSGLRYYAKRLNSAN